MADKNYSSYRNATIGLNRMPPHSAEFDEIQNPNPGITRRYSKNILSDSGLRYSVIKPPRKANKKAIFTPMSDEVIINPSIIIPKKTRQKRASIEPEIREPRTSYSGHVKKTVYPAEMMPQPVFKRRAGIEPEIREPRTSYSGTSYVDEIPIQMVEPLQPENVGTRFHFPGSMDRYNFTPPVESYFSDMRMPVMPIDVVDPIMANVPQMPYEDIISGRTKPYRKSYRDTMQPFKSTSPFLNPNYNIMNQSLPESIPIDIEVAIKNVMLDEHHINVALNENPYLQKFYHQFVLVPDQELIDTLSDFEVVPLDTHRDRALQLAHIYHEMFLDESSSAKVDPARMSIKQLKQFMKQNQIKGRVGSKSVLLDRISKHTSSLLD